jgi:hypothetical protein
MNNKTHKTLTSNYSVGSFFCLSSQNLAHYLNSERPLPSKSFLVIIHNNYSYTHHMNYVTATVIN